MNKYVRLRDTRSAGGIRLSCCIEAANSEEADAIFEERWRQKTGGTAATTPEAALSVNLRSPEALALRAERNAESVRAIREHLARA